MNNFLAILFLLGSLSITCNSQILLSVDNIDRQLLEGANAVVRYDNTKVTIKSESKVVLETEHAITLLNAKAESELLFYLHYDKATKIKVLELEIVDAHGKLIDNISKKNLEDYAADDGYTLISDSRLKYHKFITKEYPITIKRKVRLETDDLVFIPDWRPCHDYKVAVESSTFQIVNNAELEILNLAQNLDKLPNLEQSGFHYSVKNILPIRSEKFKPHRSEVFPQVSFVSTSLNYKGYKGKVKSWTEFGNWYYRSFLMDNSFSDPSSVRNELQPYLVKAANQRDTIAGVYNFVQENTRYISIQIKEGGWKPMPLDRVHNLKYGDCKALSNYTRAILDLYDIPSDYVLVNANSSYKCSINSDYASNESGNHIILRVPQEAIDDIWLECTSHDSPFDFLGSFTDDRTVLVVNKDSSHLVKTPSYSDKNSQYIESTIDLSNENSQKISSTLTNTGLQYYEGWRRAELSEKKRKEELHHRLFGFLNFTSIDSATYSFKEEKLESMENYQLEAEGYIEHMGEYIIVPIDFFSLGIPRLVTKRKRVNSLVFNRSKTKHIETTYLLPSNYMLVEAYEKVQEENQFAQYTKCITQEDNKLIIERKFRLKEGRYSTTEYLEAAKFFKKIRKEEAERITLKEKRT